MTDIPVFLPGETLPARKLQDAAGLETDYTPVLTATTTNPTLGSGATATGSWSQDGSMIDYFAFIQFGTSGVAAGSGTYQISLPVDADAAQLAASIGHARIGDAAPAASRNWTAVLSSQSLLVIQDDSGAGVTNSSPWTWAASDFIRILVRYRMEA